MCQFLSLDTGTDNRVGSLFNAKEDSVKVLTRTEPNHIGEQEVSTNKREVPQT